MQTGIMRYVYIYKYDMCIYMCVCIYIYIYIRILFGHKKEWNSAICDNVNGPREYYAYWNKSDRKRQIICYLCVEPKK